jgi:hypothetical protein
MGKNQSHNIKESGNKGFENNNININILDTGRVIIADTIFYMVDEYKLSEENSKYSTTFSLNIYKKIIKKLFFENFFKFH